MKMQVSTAVEHYFSLT